jgi:hypothetical protein
MQHANKYAPLAFSAQCRQKLFDETGRHFLVSSNQVLYWMRDPEHHFSELVNLFQNFPATHEYEAGVFDTRLIDFHEFISLLWIRGSHLVDRLIAMLSDELTLVVAVHDIEEVRRKAAEKLGGACFADALSVISKPKLNIADVLKITSVAEQGTTLLQEAFIQCVSRYQLHDPDANHLSSNLSFFDRIKLAGLLYFAIPWPDFWHRLGVNLDIETYDQARAIWQSHPIFNSHHIQATVLRALLLTLYYQQKHRALDVWKQLAEDNLDCGHDGSARGFMRDTFKMLAHAGI